MIVSNYFVIKPALRFLDAFERQMSMCSYRRNTWFIEFAKARKINIFFLAILSIFLCLSNLFAETLNVDTSHTAAVCIGYHPGESSRGNTGWGVSGAFDRESDWYRCPKNYAVMGVVRPSGQYKEISELQVFGTCCPLPAADILDISKVTEAVDCPKNSVVTGFRNPISARRPFLCTSINSSRYRLGDSHGGIMWGLSAGAAIFGKENKIIRRDELPEAIRYGVTRETRTSWGEAGCVGSPIGSLLVGKAKKRCSGIYFRQLQYTGRGNDPSSGTPVKMYPQCDSISDVYSEVPACLRTTSNSNPRNEQSLETLLGGR